MFRLKKNKLLIHCICCPHRVVDLTLGSMDFTTSTFLLTFTWPGGQLDQGTVEEYQVMEVLEMEDTFTCLLLVIKLQRKVCVYTGLKKYTREGKGFNISV